MTPPVDEGNLPLWFVPSLLLSEAFYPWNERWEVVREACESILEGQFFSRIEWMAEELSSQQHRCMRELFEDSGCELYLWARPDIDSPGLSLSSLDESVRRAAVESMRRLIGDALACGASAVCVRSGPDVEPTRRPEAIRALETSLIALCAEAEQARRLDILLEPLDRNAHKCMLVGCSQDAVALARRVRAISPRFSLCWDSGHALLNGEKLLDSLELCWPVLSQLHISSPVLTRLHPWFGDTHMCVGEPGSVVGADELTAILKRVKKLKGTDSSPVSIAIEERNWPRAPGREFVRHAQSMLIAASARVMQEEWADAG